MTVKINDNNNQAKTWPQILAVLVCCLASLSAGMHFAWASPFIPKISKDKENYDISEEEASLFTVLNPVAMLISAFLFMNFNDKYGRKVMSLCIGIPFSIAWILEAVASNIRIFYTARFIVGIGDSFIFTSLPMYIGEVCSPKVRSDWGNVFMFSIYLGQFLINLFGGYLDLSVWTTSYICVVFPITFLVLFSFMPETPYYFMMKGRYEDARKSMRWLTRKENVEEDFVQLKADVERQMSEKSTWKDLFLIPTNRKALMLGIFLRGSQQLSGIAVFSVYIQFIFKKSGSNIDPMVSTLIFCGALFSFNFFAGVLLEKIGRKKSYMLSSSVCGLILFAESVYFYLERYKRQIDLSIVSWLPMTGMIMWVIFYSIGLGIVPALMLGELFSASIKSKGLCFLVLLFALQVGGFTKLFYFMTTTIGLFSPFLMFALSSIVSTVIAWFLVPETKGKTLEQIQQSMKSSKKNTIPA